MMDVNIKYLLKQTESTERTKERKSVWESAGGKKKKRRPEACTAQNTHTHRERSWEKVIY